MKKLIGTMSLLALTLSHSPAVHAQQCARDLSKGVFIMLSGGPADQMNPLEVRNRMDELLKNLNEDPYVKNCSQDKGLNRFITDKEQPNVHIHQTQWKNLCETLKDIEASPLIIAGHSNGGAAAVSLSRCLNEKGNHKIVDLLFTADSVLTGDDLGPVDQIPPNVKLNINTYLNPNFVSFLGPFPFGHANKREGGGLDKILNAGLGYILPAIVAHRNAFYDFAGGDGYSKPNSILDLTMAFLKGASDDQLQKMALKNLGALSTLAKIDVKVESASTKNVIHPNLKPTLIVTAASPGAYESLPWIKIVDTKLKEIMSSNPGTETKYIISAKLEIDKTGFNIPIKNDDGDAFVGEVLNLSQQDTRELGLEPVLAHTGILDHMDRSKNDYVLKISVGTIRKDLYGVLNSDGVPSKELTLQVKKWKLK